MGRKINIAVKKATVWLHGIVEKAFHNGMKSRASFIFKTLPVINGFYLIILLMAVVTLPFAFFRKKEDDDTYWKDVGEVLSFYWEDPNWALLFPTKRNYNHWTAHHINQALTK